MTTTLEQHLRFWEVLADTLRRGVPLLQALEQAKAGLAGTPLETAAAALMRVVAQGSRLSEAMARGDMFSRAACTMVRAGEAGGVLDVIAERILEGHRDGTFAPPGAAKPEAEEAQAFWRGFGVMLSSGVPVLEALDVLREGMSSAEMEKAVGRIQGCIREGRSMEEALRQSPDVFPHEVCAAVAAGEQAGALDEQALRIADALRSGDLACLADDAGAAAAAASEAPIVKLCNRILTEAFKRRASDIHLEPTSDGQGRVRYRVDGLLHDAERVPQDLFKALLSRIKIMAGCDAAERRVPQDGRVLLKLEGRNLDLRVSAVPTVFGERVVIRVLDPDAVRLDLEEIGFAEDELARVRDLCYLPHGIIVCSGPAGSGKTTLLYAMLNEAIREEVCVLSVEDPVEYCLEGVGQIQVRPQLGLDFARALRCLLRQDPDVIMVGEMRYLEAWQVAAQVALTGHLLLTTTHASTSPETLRRLVEMGLEPFLVNVAVAAVISQRLVRKLCLDCRRPVQPPLHSLPAEAVEFIRGAQAARFYEPAGCESCAGTGYRGRTAVHEILVMDDRIRAAVSESGDAGAVRSAAIQSGMKPLLVSGLEKAARGITSVREVLRVTAAG